MRKPREREFQILDASGIAIPFAAFGLGRARRFDTTSDHRLKGDPSLRVYDFVLPAIIACAVLTSSQAMAAVFRADLDPASHDAAGRTAVQGAGQVNGNLTGNTLTIAGKFSGLSSNATKARLGEALVLGAPAKSFFADLAITSGPSGSITGTMTLTPAQLASLNNKTLFIQIDAVNTTAAGSLWGWFLPVTTGSGR